VDHEDAASSWTYSTICRRLGICRPFLRRTRVREANGRIWWSDEVSAILAADAPRLVMVSLLSASAARTRYGRLPNWRFQACCKLRYIVTMY